MNYSYILPLLNYYVIGLLLEVDNDYPAQINP